MRRRGLASFARTKSGCVREWLALMAAEVDESAPPSSG